MSKVVAIVEGQTEQTFVRDVLAPYLGRKSIFIRAILGGKTGKRGGVQAWEAARSDIVRVLKSGSTCTMMFDYYGMPESWPGRIQSNRMAWDQRAAYVESKLIKDIRDVMGADFKQALFIPYVQLHEFEALAFADVQILARVTAPLGNMPERYLLDQFQNVLDQAGHPEAINDSYETCPSRRITSQVKAYKKRLHGPIITKRIGLNTLRNQCTHFASWLNKLENIRNIQ